ncbi:hypothetical protein [Natronococcus wangiae]|uniref:hypothetical protein n=1 Tax=Natronococcus wangiae TaxID=3068275 RepID=UPI00273EEC16|nr:hypothetical protein [Natronococcus sp. AD5]
MADDVDPSTVADATASFLEDRADGDRVLERVLEVDDELERWTFDDHEADSGIFGEVASRGIVEKVDGEYQVADVGAVKVVLDGVEVSVDSPVDCPPHDQILCSRRNSATRNSA